MGDYLGVSINGIKMHVHCIQVHTAFGYIEGWDVHHINGNKKNNYLGNLEYIPHDEHVRITNKGMYMWNNGEKCIRARECPRKRLD